ncbi:MAG TPA: protein-glutamate O-methyltransferase CheR [Kofleriaceae bacterium]
MPSLTMSPQLFVLFSSLVEEVSGISYGLQDNDLFASKVADHAMELGYASLLDYYYRLRYDDHEGFEIRRLIEVLLVHETYFFRELPPLIELVDDHIAPVCKRQGRARVWSAACATGEEPFTLAMVLDERGLLDQVEIIATDISSSVLARAQSGRHSRRSLRDGYPPALAARYLESAPHGITVAPRIRTAVQFERVNLIDSAAVAKLGQFDAILCRNVLIYFKETRVLSVVDRLASALKPGGLLAVGVSESLMRFGTSLVCEERGGSFFYRRAT